MTAVKPRDTTPTCEACGWTGKLTTGGLSAIALRRHRCTRTAITAARHARVAARKAASGPEADCLHRTTHPHGTRTRYVLDKCRCRPCRDACAEYERHRHRQIAYGRARLIDATPTRAHVTALMALGMGHKRIARAAGVHPRQIGALLYGSNAKRNRLRRITPATAAKILAVTLELAPGALVDATGLRRRVQALAAIGWSPHRLAPLLGMTDANFHACLGKSRVTKGTADKVAALYDELWDTPPSAGSWRDQGGINRTVTRARTAGWPPPLAWDDDTIDDPTAQPAFDAPAGEDLVDDVAVDRALRGERLTLTRAERAELVRRAIATGRPSPILTDVLKVSGTVARKLVEAAA